MEAVFAAAIGVLAACGIYLVLRARTFSVVLGLTLMTYAVTLFLLGMGRLTTGKPPIIAPGAQYADPLPQALVLTAIVIGFAMTAFVMVLALRSRALRGSDHVDGDEPPNPASAPGQPREPERPEDAERARSSAPAAAPAAAPTAAPSVPSPASEEAR
ncbi:Na+/H+ antiporter subunit C [Cupriavidus sp. ISTL7]|nr:Na+/H+ antiporter subunit C [Cupriavidus sp. ISTL7]